MRITRRESLVTMESLKHEDTTYGPTEVAAILGISKKTLYNWEKQKKLPFTPERDVRNWRKYTSKQLRWLKQNIYDLMGPKGG